jgi:preprotein translocase subunit SecB
MTDNQAGSAATGAAGAQNDAKQLVLQKIYLKDCSFESPNSPEMFTVAQWDPKVQMNITSSTKAIAQDVYEIVLQISVEAKQSERAAFLCEIQQAGVVTLRGFTEDERRRLLGGYCPGLVFPYAREAISDLVAKGGFPQFLLQPLNFEAMYLKQAEEMRQGAAAPGPGAN